MKKIVLFLTGFMMCFLLTFSQYSKTNESPSFRYVASPGFINISEINGAIGIEDSISGNAKYYFGLTNVFGYQINRNFSGGIGTGCLLYENTFLIPVYLEYKYSAYLKGITPFLYADGGGLIDPTDLYGESKIFINPGAGLSRNLSPKLEAAVSVGYVVQSRSSLSRISYINFKLGVIYRKNAFRYFKPHRVYPE